MNLPHYPIAKVHGPRSEIVCPLSWNFWNDLLCFHFLSLPQIPGPLGSGDFASIQLLTPICISYSVQWCYQEGHGIYRNTASYRECKDSLLAMYMVTYKGCYAKGNNKEFLEKNFLKPQGSRSTGMKLWIILPIWSKDSFHCRISLWHSHWILYLYHLVLLAHSWLFCRFATCIISEANDKWKVTVTYF